MKAILTSILVAACVTMISSCDEVAVDLPSSASSNPQASLPLQAPPPQPTSLVLDFNKPESIHLISLTGSPADPSVVSGDGIVLDPMQGFLTAPGLPAEPGQKWTVEWTAEALADSTNGNPNNFFIGAVSKDINGTTLQWWFEQPGLEVSEGVRSGVTELVMAPGVATVHIGMNGNWAPDNGAIGNGRIVVRSARIAKS
jgi:hypothetical protein